MKISKKKFIKNNLLKNTDQKMSKIREIEKEIRSLNSTRHRSPIMRVQRKNAMKKQKSMKAFISNRANPTLEFGDCEPRIRHNKSVIFTGKNSINDNFFKKTNSITKYHKFLNNTQKNRIHNNRTPIKRNRNYKNFADNKINSMNCSLNEKFNDDNNSEINRTDNNINRNKNNKNNDNNLKNNNKVNNNTYKKLRKAKILNPKIIQEITKSDNEKDLYCINCYNRQLMPFDDTKIPFKNMNKSFDSNYYHKTLELKKIDEDYICKKVLENEKKQLIAFNKLKDEGIKNPQTRKEKLQSINENEDNPLIGLNLQDYLYYNNKKNNEKLNKAMIDNINLYNVNKPRKAIKDYYKKVQYQIPILEKKFGPSTNYKAKYIETLKKQMDDKEKEKEKLKKTQIKTEIEENKKYNEFLSKLKRDEYEQKKLKQKMILDSNRYMEEYQKKREQLLKRDNQNAQEDRNKQFKRNQKEYNDFIKQQKMNEINSIQNWLNENTKQKQKKLNDDYNDAKKWDEYNKEFNRKFYENTYAEKCVECNAMYPVNKLYELPNKK